MLDFVSFWETFVLQENAIIIHKWPQHLYLYLCLFRNKCNIVSDEKFLTATTVLERVADQIVVYIRN